MDHFQLALFNKMKRNEANIEKKKRKKLVVQNAIATITNIHIEAVIYRRERSRLEKPILRNKISSKQVKKILSPWKLFEFWFFSSFDVSKQSLNPLIESFS